MRLKVSNVCQVFNKEEFIATTTRDGITFTNNGDGTFTINGTATANVFIELFKSGTDITGFNINHKYLICGNLSNTIQIFETLSGNGTRHYEDSIFTCVKSKGYLDLRIVVGTNATDYIFRPQLFDLTEMYGIGNEPTTVEQFRQDFPNEMYDYSPECWKKFRRLKYIANKEPVQLLNKSEFRETYVNNGITYTNNGNGTFTLNGTTTSASRSSIYSSDSNTNIVKANHKYLMLGFPIALDGNNYVYFQYYPFNTRIKYYILNNANGYLFFTPTDDGNRWNIFLSFKTTGFTVNNITIKPQLFDLTEMYGVGNEPTTVAQFRADFPNELYDYNPYNYLTLNRGKYIANKQPVQLLDKSKFKAVTSKNVTATPDITNGMWTISGAATASEYLPIGVYYPGTDFNIGDKLFLRHSNIDNSVYFPYAAWYDKDNKYLGEYGGMGVFSVTNPKTAYIACYFTTRTVGDINVTTQVQLFNLTRMYGKGNEPTAAEFVAQYPGFDYPVNKYNAITFR